MRWYPPMITQEQFSNPDKLDQSIIDLAHRVRTEIAVPMYFSKMGNVIYNRERDAVPPDSTSHTGFSLHKYGIDHIESYKQNRIVLNDKILGKALDFHVKITSPADFVDIVLDIIKVEIPGLGIYPQWNGFHIDVRGQSHPSYGAKWIRIKEDKNVDYPFNATNLFRLYDKNLYRL